MEHISFDDWSERLDHFNNTTNDSVWLPAYGFPNHGDDSNSSEDSLFLATAVTTDGAENSANISNCSGSSAFLVLETIFEEESDDLDTSDTQSVDSSDSDNDDVASVIHISPDDSESERDVEVPKKRRKRELIHRSRLVSDDDESSLSLSRSSSLIQFESLEQAMEQEEESTPIPVFRTSATHKPFLTESEPPSFSSFSFDSLEQRQSDSSSQSRNDSMVKDSLEENSTDSDTESSDSETYFLDRNKMGNLRQNRLRSYRSFDSLLHAVRPVKFSNSLENNTILTEECDIVPDLKPINISTLRSSENLSEDSGFGEIKLSPPREGKSRDITPTIPEEGKVLFNDNLVEICEYQFSDNFSSIIQNETTTTPTSINNTTATALEVSLPTLGGGIKIENSSSPQHWSWGISRELGAVTDATEQQCSTSIENIIQDTNYNIEDNNISFIDNKINNKSEIIEYNNSNYNQENECLKNTDIDDENLIIQNLSIQDENFESIGEILNSDDNYYCDNQSDNSNFVNSDTKSIETVIENTNFELLLNNKIDNNSIQSNNCEVTEVKAEIHHSKEEEEEIENFELLNSKPKIVDIIKKSSPEKYTTIKIVSIKIETLNNKQNIINNDDSNLNKNDNFRNSFTEIIHNSKSTECSDSSSLEYTKDKCNSITHDSTQELSINIAEPPRKVYNSAPSLLLANKTLKMASRNMALTPPTEITEEIIQKKVQVGGIPVSPDSSPNKNKSTKFGNFFQRFSFRKNKKQKSPTTKSQENLDAENEAFDSVQKVAEELSNLDQVSPKLNEKTAKVRPPLPPVGPPKSRLLGVVGKKHAPAHNEAPQQGEEWNQKIDNSRNNGEQKKASSLVNLGTMLNVVEIDLNHDYEANEPVNKLVPTQVPDSRAKSMEFLLDEENKAAVQPPENELRKVSERQLSEHELRVQRSLQRLNVPDWYKNSSHTPTSGSFLLKRSGSGTKPGGWQGLNSKTTSLSSLQQSPCLRSKLGNTAYSRDTRDGNTASPSPIISPSPQERLSFSYAPFSRWSTSRLHSGPTSANTSPSGSTRSSFHYRQPYLGWRSQEKLLTSTPSHYRTPAERLAANMVTKPPLPPAVNVQPPSQAHINEVHSSIKEVTSAIVHYVTEKNLSPANTARPADISAERSPSPRGSKSRVWVESSFVGSRPIDSPQTPHIGDSESTHAYHTDKLQSGHAFMDIRHTNGATVHQNGPEVTIATITDTSINFNIDDTNSSRENLDNASDSETNDEIDHVLHKPKLQDELTQLLENFGNSRPTSATIEDVLDSLLGLPQASRSPSPVISPGASTNYLHSSGGIKSSGSRKNSIQEDSANVDTNTIESPQHVISDNNIRRHSSGALSRQRRDEKTRRVSFELEPSSLRDVCISSETLVKCRYAKCGKESTVTEARRTFKTCHNCNTHIYCSRECRRAHWDKGHRKTCLHGRIGALCRRVVTACKEHAASLEALSKLSRRGYLSHGKGCVKVFFSSPELAERFTNAVTSASVTESLLPGEPYFIKWADLLPTEMGNDQYKELLRLCKSYNPDTRLILYVAVCVISEIPSSGAVKWERQLITRCSKLRLHRNHVVTANIVQDNINITRDMDNPETLILTPLNFSSTNKTRQKEIVVTNIQRQLRQRGVSLRKQFPEVYRKLCAYVDTNDSFTPVTIHPKDTVTGRNFMCIIMPEPNPGKLEHVPTDSSRVQTIDIGMEQDAF